nr:unnamed protein product [Callosobruchus chinensis]
MKAVGQWFDKEKKHVLEITYERVCNFVFLVYILCCHFLLLTVIQHPDCLKMVFDAGFLYIHAVTAVSITILLKSRETKRCFQLIMNFEECLLKNKHPVVLETYVRHCKSTNALCLFLASAVMATAIAWFIFCEIQ